MKVLLRAYTQLNVGDDLFIHIITSRYPNAEFTLAAETGEQYSRFIDAHPNLRAFSGHTLFYRAARRAGHIPLIEKSILRRFDAVVYIGGSIFMENTADRYLENALFAEISYCARKNIPYYILSCNFGPYVTEEYREKMKHCFDMCADVCFRDRASYELFRDVPSVRFAPDAAFSCGFERPDVRGGVLGIAPIDYTNRREGAEYGRKYLSGIADKARAFMGNGGRAEIFCFCRFEGDCRAAEELRDMLGEYADSGRVMVKTYDGDIEGFVKDYLSCERVIASRFHAILLALMYSVPLIAHIYSKKTENFLADTGIFDKLDSARFLKYDLNENYVNSSQKIWVNFDKMYKDFK